MDVTGEEQTTICCSPLVNTGDNCEQSRIDHPTCLELLLEDFEFRVSSPHVAGRVDNMTRPLRKHPAPSWHITTIPAIAMCLLLLPGGADAFSVPVPSNSLLYRLVDHVDQLQQQQQGPRPAGHGSTGDSSSGSEVVPPPHLFRIPAPGGDVCLVVDEKGAYHAVRDAFPPLGLPVSSTGVVDTQVPCNTNIDLCTRGTYCC